MLIYVVVHQHHDLVAGKHVGYEFPPVNLVVKQTPDVWVVDFLFFKVQGFVDHLKVFFESLAIHLKDDSERPQVVHEIEEKSDFLRYHVLFGVVLVHFQLKNFCLLVGGMELSHDLGLPAFQLLNFVVILAQLGKFLQNNVQLRLVFVEFRRLHFDDFGLFSRSGF